MSSSDYPDTLRARSQGFPHHSIWDVPPAQRPPTPNGEHQPFDVYPLAPPLTPNELEFAATEFHPASRTHQTDNFSVADPLTIPDAPSYVDPYAGVIIASSCPTSCPLCSSSNAPSSEYEDGSLDVALVDPLFSHPESPAGLMPYPPSEGSEDVGNAALAPSFRDSPELDDCPDAWYTTDHTDWGGIHTISGCDPSKSLPFTWTTSTSSSTTLESGEAFTAIPVRDSTPALSSPGDSPLHPVPQYPYHTLFDADVPVPSFSQNMDATPPSPALDIRDEHYNTAATATPRTPPEAASSPRDTDPYLVSASPQGSRSRRARRLARCRAITASSSASLCARTPSTSIPALDGTCPCLCLVVPRAVQEFLCAGDRTAVGEHLLGLDCPALSRSQHSRVRPRPYSVSSRARRILACA